jgi:hypothetical protein
MTFSRNRTTGIYSSRWKQQGNSCLEWTAWCRGRVTLCSRGMVISSLPVFNSRGASSYLIQIPRTKTKIYCLIVMNLEVLWSSCMFELPWPGGTLINSYTTSRPELEKL